MAVRKKCISNGCVNHSDEGAFVGDLCYPCYSFITDGRAEVFRGHSFMAREMRELSRWRKIFVSIGETPDEAWDTLTFTHRWATKEELPESLLGKRVLVIVRPSRSKVFIATPQRINGEIVWKSTEEVFPAESVTGWARLPVPF